MSGYGSEAGDLATCGGSLLINMGTMNDTSMSNYLEAIKAYNARGSPVVLDPVGAGATEIRKNAVKELMTGGYFDLIKGNEGELKQIWGKTTGRQHGVDSGPTTMNNREKATMVQDLAQKEREFLTFSYFLFVILLKTICRQRRPPNRKHRLPQRRHPYLRHRQRPSLPWRNHWRKILPSLQITKSKKTNPNKTDRLRPRNNSLLLPRSLPHR